ncbi:MAG: hypothetical protein HC910_21745 [Spirulinaceae cyanobacterium SM2_1_0]|nr:hypothetical protein [Spirulinaceae cyanobacterium SM2_1_0]
MVLNRAGQLTERGYGILSGFDAARSEGVSLSDYAHSIQPSQSSEIAPIEAELLPDAGSHLARFSARQRQNQGRLAGLLRTVEGIGESERQLAEVQDAAIRTQAQNDALREMEIYLSEKQRIKNDLLRKMAEQALAQGE